MSCIRHWVQNGVLLALLSGPPKAICEPSEEAPADSAQSVAVEAGDEAFIRGGRTSISRSFEMVDNRIFVQAHVNDRGPFQFILDSGSINVLTVETAESLNLPLEPAGRQSGAGSETVESWTTQVDRVTLGDLVLSHQTCLVLSLAPIVKAIGFERIDGVLGYELFRHFVVELDYERERVTFYEPRTWKGPQDADTVPFELHGHIPVVDGAVDGVQGRFFVDTGDRSSLTLFRPFVEKHAWTQHKAPTPEIITGWGIGGPIPAQVTRTDSLRIHASVVQGVVTRLPTLTRGAFALEGFAGSVGNGVLKKFTLILDFPRQQLVLRRNATAPRRDPWDGAGMWLVQCEGGFEVRDVLEGGPAALAGIRDGDVIVSVDGRNAASQPLLEVRRRLSDERAGEKVRLELQGHPKPRIAELTLRVIL